MVSRREDIDDDEVWYMYNVNKMTQQEIADYFGVTRACIYCRLNPERKKENNNNQKENKKEWNKQNYQDNREEILEKAKEQRLENPEKQKEHNDKWRLENPDYDKDYRQTISGKDSARRSRAEWRGLGSISLNKPFPGSEFHHIDEEHGIHIPAELHRSIWHNLKTGQGMEEINTIAFQYITEDTFDKLIAGEI